MLPYPEMKLYDVITQFFTERGFVIQPPHAEEHHAPAHRHLAADRRTMGDVRVMTLDEGHSFAIALKKQPQTPTKFTHTVFDVKSAMEHAGMEHVHAGNYGQEVIITAKLPAPADEILPKFSDALQHKLQHYVPVDMLATSPVTPKPSLETLHRAYTGGRDLADEPSDQWAAQVLTRAGADIYHGIKTRR